MHTLGAGYEPGRAHVRDRRQRQADALDPRHARNRNLEQN